MANRPIFVPKPTQIAPIREIPMEFTWHAGMALKQKQKSITSLHAAARRALNLEKILEVSTKSDLELGQRLSAFNMRLPLKDGYMTTVESAYQSSKVFSGGGPFWDLLKADSRTAKTDERLRSHGHLLRFNFEDTIWPLEPITAFYDWLYIKSLAGESSLSSQVLDFDAFTDIEFNPNRSVNCQARSVALFCSLRRSGQLEAALSSPERFIAMAQGKPSSTDQNRLF